MKARLTARAAVALASASAVAITGLYVAPAHAARSTVVVVESNTFTSLNPGTPDTNIVINGDVGYLTSSNFWYYDDKANLLTNTTLGTIKVVKKAAGDFEVKYTINPGRKWSDGSPITAADLLLTHVTASAAYSKKAGLGDPSDSSAAPAFNSVGYGGVYDQHISGLPVLSSDGMSATFKYDSAIPDYVLNGPSGVFPVHSLELLAAGKKTLPSVAEANAATAKFVKDFNSYNTAALKDMGAVYSTGYNTTTVDSSTNPNLLVGNGMYQVQSVDTNQIKLGLNSNYNSGPANSGITTIVIKQGIADGSPSAQALANKDIDVYQGQPTADAVAQLKAISSAKVVTTSSLAYEHIELRVASSDSSTYKGPWAGMSQKSIDMRTAFLLAYPRQDIVDKLVKPVNPNAKVLDSVWALPGTQNNEALAKSNLSNLYTFGTQAQRTAKALTLMKKYFPSAGTGATPVTINLLWGSPGNTRRANEAALIIAAEKSIGYNVIAPATAGWGGKLASSNYDAHFFIFDQTANPQDAQDCGTFQTGAGSNYTGYSNAAVDAACTKLQAVTLSSHQVFNYQLAAERQINKDAFFLGIFQNPEVTAYSSDLQGVKPAPISPSLFWNFWEWHF